MGKVKKRSHNRWKPPSNVHTQAYSYAPLRGAGEMRLLTVLPASFEDPIQVCIDHVIVRFPEEPCEQSVNEADNLPLDVDTTLPEGWRYAVALDGRHIFWDDEDKTCRAARTTWEHPNPVYNNKSRETASSKTRPQASPAFEALSYAWGKSQKSHVLWVINRTFPEDQSSLRAQSNLANALRHLRLADVERTLWIDAICINQSDVQEKNAEIRRMWKIYKFASRVIVWLSTRSSDSALAFKGLSQIATQLVLDRYYGLLPSPGAKDPDTYMPPYRIPLSTSTWRAICNLLRRPYFRRLWIVSEIALAGFNAVFLCGHDTLQALEFRSSILCLLAKEIELYEGTTGIGIKDNLVAVKSLVRDTDHEPFHELLSRFQEQLCSDPRDKIYGLLSMACDTLRNRITIDYSLDIATITRQTMLEVCNFYQRLEMLDLCRFTPGKHTGPSWVPDLSLKNVYIRLSPVCSGISRCEPLVPVDDVIAVTGVHCCTVLEPRGLVPVMTNAFIRLLQSWAPQDPDAETYPTGESRLRAFVRTILVDDISDHYVFDNKSGIDGFVEWIRPILYAQNGVKIGINGRRGIEIQMLESHTWKSAFFLADGGYFGIGSESVEKGDLVCALLGCNSLTILRANPENEEQFLVIGNCFVHGFQEANAFLGPLPKPWTLRYIVSDAFRTGVCYYNEDTEKSTPFDPRLGPVPEDWEEIWEEETNEQPRIAWRFRNKRTDEVMNSDPRMDSKALKDRDIPLQTFYLA